MGTGNGEESASTSVAKEEAWTSWVVGTDVSFSFYLKMALDLRNDGRYYILKGHVRHIRVMTAVTSSM